VPSFIPTPPKQTFIPKQPIASRRVLGRSRQSGWFMTFAVIILILSIITYGFLFLYKIYLMKSTDNLSVSLERAKGAFEPALISELERVDKRLRAADALLSNHISLSSFFEILEVETIDTIRYDGFQFRVEEDGTYTISLKGEAKDYASIALQSDIFSDNQNIKNHIFSDLNSNKRGNISFSFSALIDQKALKYSALQ